MRTNGVTTTVTDILEAAYGTSMENVQGTIASESTELLQLVVRAMRGIYAVAARVNPTFFADKLTLDYETTPGGWARPKVAESIWRAEKTDGTEVVFVSFDDKKAEPGKPAVFSFGQYYYPAGNAKDPTSADQLVLYFSRRPDSPASLDDTLDRQWTEQFNSLLINVVGLYLAEKDSRAGEVPGFEREIQKDSVRFVQFLEHETLGVVKRFNHIRRFNTQTSVPVMSILTGRGGAAVNAGAGA